LDVVVVAVDDDVVVVLEKTPFQPALLLQLQKLKFMEGIGGTIHSMFTSDLRKINSNDIFLKYTLWHVSTAVCKW
jgi:hypothetical protein